MLRALRDGGDLRGIGWLLAGYSSTSLRIRREAEFAMDGVSQEFEAVRMRWAGDFDVDAYRPFVEPHAARAAGLASAERLSVRKIAAQAEYVMARGATENAMQVEP